MKNSQSNYLSWQPFLQLMDVFKTLLELHNGPHCYGVYYLMISLRISVHYHALVSSFTNLNLAFKVQILYYVHVIRWRFYETQYMLSRKVVSLQLKGQEVATKWNLEPNTFSDIILNFLVEFQRLFKILSSS